MNWKIFYGDGRTYSDADGRAEDAPAVNVQAIAVRDPDHGRLVLSQKDFYLWRNGEWHPVDWFGLLDHLMDMGLLKTGRSIDGTLFRRILHRATNDPDLPPSS